MGNIATLVPRKKGEPRPAGAGRKKGVLNKTTQLLKNTILMAGDAVGKPRYDKRTKTWKEGDEGLLGYIKWLALTEPKTYGMLLAKVLPTQVTGDGGGPVRIIDENTTPQEAAILYMAALKAPPMIDVTPNPVRQLEAAE